MTKAKTRTSRPRTPATNAYAKLGASPLPSPAAKIPLGPDHREHSGVRLDHPYQSATAMEAAAKAKTRVPSPTDIEDALRKQPGQECPSANAATQILEAWSEDAKSLARDVAKIGRWFGRKLRWFAELVGTAIIAVVTPMLTAAVDGVCILVFVLTIWELWTPAKAMADQVMDYLVLTVAK